MLYIFSGDEEGERKQMDEGGGKRREGGRGEMREEEGGRGMELKQK